MRMEVEDFVGLKVDVKNHLHAPHSSLFEFDWAGLVRDFSDSFRVLDDESLLDVHGTAFSLRLALTVFFFKCFICSAMYKHLERGIEIV